MYISIPWPPSRPPFPRPLFHPVTTHTNTTDTAPGKRVQVVGADGSPRKGDATAAVLVSCTARLPDGSELRFRVGKELFHCPELLFRPDLFGEGIGEEEKGAASA